MTGAAALLIRNDRYGNDWYEMWTGAVKSFNNGRYEKG
jgi:hypothetical protein